MKCTDRLDVRDLQHLQEWKVTDFLCDFRPAFWIHCNSAYIHIYAPYMVMMKAWTNARSFTGTRKQMHRSPTHAPSPYLWWKAGSGGFPVETFPSRMETRVLLLVYPELATRVETRTDLSTFTGCRLFYFYFLLNARVLSFSPTNSRLWHTASPFTRTQFYTLTKCYQTSRTSSVAVCVVQ